MSGPTSAVPVAEAAAHLNNDDVIRLAGNTLTHFCHQAAHRSGWWSDRGTGLDLREAIHRDDDAVAVLIGKAVVAQKLMLIVSEVSEAMEGFRKGLADDHLPHRAMLGVELADAVIRIADLAGACGLDLGGAIVEKLAYNAQRADHKPEARAALGGKAF